MTIGGQWSPSYDHRLKQGQPRTGLQAGGGIAAVPCGWAGPVLTLLTDPEVQKSVCHLSSHLQK